MQISYFAVMDNPEDEAALNAELARLRRIEQAAREFVAMLDTVSAYSPTARFGNMVEFDAVRGNKFATLRNALESK